jgi:hypothetical protein
MPWHCLGLPHQRRPWRRVTQTSPAKAALRMGEFNVGPHIMIVSPHQDELEGFSRDGSDGMPYVAHLPNGTQLYLVMPFQQVHHPR